MGDSGGFGGVYLYNRLILSRERDVYVKTPFRELREDRSDVRVSGRTHLGRSTVTYRSLVRLPKNFRFTVVNCLDDTPFYKNKNFFKITS